MLLSRSFSAIIIFVSILLLLVLAFRVAGAIQLRDTMAALKQKCAIARQARREIEDYEQIELYFRRAKLFDQWWEAVCFAAEKMDFARGLLPLTNRDGTSRTLSWERDGQAIDVHEIIRMTLAVRDRRAGLPLNLEIQVCTNGSLESAGRRITLFGRLLEKYSVANLPSIN